VHSDPSTYRKHAKALVAQTPALQAAIDRCAESDDYREGRRAFMDKRKPQFKGR